ncbi:MAG TPA: hypothetical protein VGD01_16895 [Candidatus Elarobacter sp.]|jgi:hypothetical protein
MNDAAQLLRDLYGERAPDVDERVLAALRTYAPPAPERARDLRARLPEPHRRLLDRSDGLDRLAGSYRLFGAGPDGLRDMAWWNERETWRFAWGERADGYLFVGESVLGNQYAYREDDLARGGDAVPVHELYAVTLEPIVQFDDFDEFLRQVFLSEEPGDPYHRRIASARRQMGAFALDQVLIFVPSPLLSGGRLEGLELAPVPAVAAMTINGDLYTQLAHRSDLNGLQNLEPYDDERGRARLRAVWS